MVQICNEDGTYETLSTTKTSMYLLQLHTLSVMREMYTKMHKRFIILHIMYIAELIRMGSNFVRSIFVNVLKTRKAGVKLHTAILVLNMSEGNTEGLS